MASTFKMVYPAINTIALSLNLASLADDNTNGIAGRSSGVVDNTTNLDLDHILSGFIKAGTSPTAGRTIEVWVWGAIQIVSGTPSYPDGITGSDANKTFTSRNILLSGLAPVRSITVDATTGNVYPIKPTSIASCFDGVLPPYWGIFILNRTGVALDATAGNHVLCYERVQQQSV